MAKDEVKLPIEDIIANMEGQLQDDPDSGVELSSDDALAVILYVRAMLRPGEAEPTPEDAA